MVSIRPQAPGLGFCSLGWGRLDGHCRCGKAGYASITAGNATDIESNEMCTPEQISKIPRIIGGVALTGEYPLFQKSQVSGSPVPGSPVPGSPVLGPLWNLVFGLFLEFLPDNVISDEPFFIRFFLTRRQKSRMAIRHLWPGTFLVAHKSPLY